MIAAQPTKQDLQNFWMRDPLAFHTSPMPGFEEQELSAAQWALLTQPAMAFWADKSPPQDPALWAWAVDSATQGSATLNLMAQLRIPSAPDTLVRLLFRSANTHDKIALATMTFASEHPRAWETEKDKTSAPELLASPKNTPYFSLLDAAPHLLTWKKDSTGNGLLHTAVLHGSKNTIAMLLEKSVVQHPNNAGLTPMEMAKENSIAWPSSFGIAKSAVRSEVAPLNSLVATTRSRAKVKFTRSADQIDLF